MDVLIAPYLKMVCGVGATDTSKNISNWMSPLKIFEYMTFKKPIISSDLEVLHDILNENNSILCNPDNIDEWVKAIYKLKNDKQLSRKLSEQAYKEITQYYTWRHRAKRIINLITE